MLHGDFLSANMHDPTGWERTVMKRLALWIMLGAICLGIVSIGQAQQNRGTGKMAFRELPAGVCRAIEQYIAKVDAARSLTDKASREEKYAEAREELAAVLKSYDKAFLITEATDYAGYTELVAGTDPTDAKFNDAVEKRLRARTALLEICENGTVTR
jgi:hypothetical protein